MSTQYLKNFIYYQYLLFNVFYTINTPLLPPPKAAGVYNSLLYTKKYLQELLMFYN